MSLCRLALLHVKLWLLWPAMASYGCNSFMGRLQSKSGEAAQVSRLRIPCITQE